MFGLSTFATIAIPIIALGYVVMAVVIIRDTIRKRQAETLRKRRDDAEGYGIEPDPWLAGLCDQAIPPRTFSEKTIIPQHPRKVADAN